MKETTGRYGQNICIHARIGFTEKGEMREVSLSHRGETVCNNAWIGVVPSSKLTPVCEVRCQECIDKGLDYTHLLKERKPRIGGFGFKKKETL